MEAMALEQAREWKQKNRWYVGWIAHAIELLEALRYS
jgi:hypothetical protein